MYLLVQSDIELNSVQFKELFMPQGSSIKVYASEHTAMYIWTKLTEHNNGTKSERVKQSLTKEVAQIEQIHIDTIKFTVNKTKQNIQIYVHV